MAREDSLDIFGSDPFGRDYLYGLSSGNDGMGLAPYGIRYSESLSQPTTVKRGGYLGDIGTMNEPMTELSSSFEVNGRSVQYPLVVPTLTVDELQLLRAGGEPTPSIYNKAEQFAMGRLSRGQDPFATTQDLRYPQPQGLNPAPSTDQMQATPRGFISGLFSDVLGRTFDMPALPRTGIPSLDLFAPNMNAFNRLSLGDVQKTAERISYGEPLTTGSGMTLRPRDETIFAGMAVAPFVGEAASLGARAGRAGARMVGQGIAENVAMGRPNLPSMFAEPRSSLFAVEPSPMMPKPQAPVSELGFYSAAEQAALNLPRNKGTGQSFLNDLMKAPDVKKDELAWTGLDDFLKDKPNVTKQEVQDYLANNKVDLQEVRMGEQPPYDKIRLATLENELSQLKEHPIDAPTFGEEKFNELLKLQNIRDQSTVDSLYRGAEVAINNAQRAQAAGNKELANKYFLESEMLNTRAEALDLQGLGVPNPTRYSNYQLAGGENYREILLKLPNQWDKPRAAQIANEERIKALRQEMYGTSGTNEIRSEISRLQNENTALQKQISEAPIYKSSHFDEPNILAHIRVNDRVDADGKKMLLVEEIQSDWHQAGREKGYKTGKERNPAQVEKELTITTQKRSRLIDEAAALPDSEMTKFKAMNEEIKALGEQATKLNEEWTNLLNKPEGVPDAPFKDTWYQLALKRVMKYAADNGYERVGLTTGEQQAKRYDLSKQVGEVHYNPDTKKLFAYEKNGFSTILNETVEPNKLSDYIGKEAAEKLLNKKPTVVPTDKGDVMHHILKNADLKIGGEGMKKYYDEIYPKFLEKYGKKWDASVGETNIITEDNAWNMAEQIKQRGISDAQWRALSEEDKLKLWNDIKQSVGRKQEPIRYIDITPKMKESVGKGQPLFTAIPAGTLGLGGLEYADPFASPLTEDTTR
jgi:hypothetical protein